jgi:phosphoribosylglycinamide formyltransferase 1
MSDRGTALTQARRARVRAVLEQPPSRITLIRRRARRLGWPTVGGQVAFVSLAVPILRLAGRRRIREVSTGDRLQFGPITDAVHVSSVNDSETIATLRDLGPAVVVVHGTRIILPRTLGAIDVPVVNMHAGVTPRFRGVHGGYWALAEGRPDLVGTTIHLVDAGVDTGGILEQATFEATRRDNFATLPYGHLVCGLPMLVEHIGRILAGASPTTVAPLPGAEQSCLRWHPTLWGYLATFFRRGVR